MKFPDSEKYRLHTYLISSILVFICCFLVEFLFPNLIIYQPKILDSIQSPENNYSLAIEVSLISFILLERLLDIMYDSKKGNSLKWDKFIHLIILVYFLVSSIILICVSFNNLDYSLLYTIYQIRIAMLISSCLLLATVYAKEFWTYKMFITATLFGSISCILRVVSMKMTSSTTTLDLVSTIFLAFFMIVLVIYWISWVIHLLLLYEKETLISKNQRDCTFYLTISLGALVSLISLEYFQYNVPAIYDISAAYLLSHEIVYIGYIVLFALYQSRSFRLRASKNEVF